VSGSTNGTGSGGGYQSYAHARDVREFFKEKVFRTVIPRNVRLAEAPSFDADTEPDLEFPVLDGEALDVLEEADLEDTVLDEDLPTARGGVKHSRCALREGFGLPSMPD
jgi:hypothetical protein